MSIRFVSHEIWPRLRQLARRRGRRAFVAVPFLGTGAAQRLLLRDRDVLVTKFDTAAIRAGLVSPREVVAFIKRGVEVHSVRNLHAKVYVFGDVAIVSSANVSASSETQLVEGGCEFTVPKVVSQCRRFILGLRGEIVELKFARSQIGLWRPPQGPYRKTEGTRRAHPVAQAPLLAVALDEVKYDDADEAAAQTARDTAKRRLTNKDRFRLDDFR